MAAPFGPVVYVNDGETAITPIVGKTVQPGGTFQTSDGLYLKYAKGLRVKRHRPAPWKTVFSGELSGWSDKTGLEVYGQLEFKNKTGNSVTIIVNGDTDDPYVLVDGEIKVFDQDREVSSLSVSGSGGGNFYVYGFSLVG